MKAMKRIVIASILTLAVSASAQTTANKKTLTLEGAKKVIAGAMAFAKEKKTTGVIAVVDDGGNLIAVERIDGTFGAGANISIGKARTAVLFKRPTRFFEELINASGKGRTVMTALNDFTPLIGGVPIIVDGEIVGGVGVSGAASAQQDEEEAMAGAAALSGQPMSSLPVTYIEGDKVTAAFAKGMPLLEQSNYKIHASRREGEGKAEVHTLDTDTIYVLEGTATFVTGGKVVDGKEIAPNEIRGAAIEGGESRKIAKGDVIVVPNGTPHQFKDVTLPFTYYVVKVQ